MKWLKKILGPKHTAESVAKTLADGLRDGSIVLDKDGTTEPTDNDTPKRLGALKPKHTVESVIKELIDGLQDGSIVLDRPTTHEEQQNKRREQDGPPQVG